METKEEEEVREWEWKWKGWEEQKGVNGAKRRMAGDAIDGRSGALNVNRKRGGWRERDKGSEDSG